MDILLSINRSYIEVAGVLITSILKNNIDDIHFHIINDDFMDEDQYKLETFLLGRNDDSTIDYYKMTNSEFKVIKKVGSDRWPVTVYYRLLAPFVLEDRIERVLYLDADMVVNGTLSELYNIDLMGNCVAMCEDTFVNSYVEYRKRLDIPKPYIYCNSGMILMDLVRIRTMFSLDDVYSIADSFFDRLLFPDQDILNIMFYDKCQLVDYRKYNFICSYQRESRKELIAHSKEAIIFHFAGGEYNKPWEVNYIGDFHDVYWKYAITIWGKNRERKCFWNNKLLKVFYLIRKRIDLFIEFHF